MPAESGQRLLRLDRLDWVETRIDRKGKLKALSRFIPIAAMQRDDGRMVLQSSIFGSESHRSL